jgi:hypothetical protein
VGSYGVETGVVPAIVVILIHVIAGLVASFANEHVQRDPSCRKGACNRMSRCCTSSARRQCRSGTRSSRREEGKV